MGTVRAIWACGLAVLLAVAAPALAREPAIADGAEVFSKDAVVQATRQVEQVKRDFGRDVVIETYPAIPDNLLVQYNALGKDRFFQEWIGKEGRALRVNGILILITKDPSHLQVAIANDASRRAFTPADRDALRDLMLASFKQKQFDAGLTRGMDLVVERMGKNLGRDTKPADEPVAAAPASAPAPADVSVGPPPTAAAAAAAAATKPADPEVFDEPGSGAASPATRPTAAAAAATTAP